MQLRAASEHDVTQLARLMGGDPSQASTAAAMRLFDVIEVNRVMMESTGGWRHVTVADMEGPVGFIAVGEPFLSMTPEIVELCMRLYGEGFASIIGPRLAALQRVQSTYPPECLRVSEIHIDPGHRRRGIGAALITHAVEGAEREGLDRLGLQTLVGNPARDAFEAWGFEVAETTNDAVFEDLTGAPGYHLMIREL